MGCTLDCEQGEDGALSATKKPLGNDAVDLNETEMINQIAL